MSTFQLNWAYETKNNQPTTGLTRTFLIPATALTGNGYKISIGSTSPTFNGSGGNGASLSFIINAVLTPGSIGSNQVVCFNAVPAALTSTLSPTGGNGTYLYQWQSSLDNVNFLNIPGATTSTYAPPMLSQTTYFRRIVSSGPCASQVSNVINITVNFAGRWTGALSTDYLNSANWQCGVIPVPATNVIIPSGLARYPVLNSGIGYANNLTIESGASIIISGGNLKIAGTISNSGTFNAINGAVELGGSVPRIIAAGLFTSNQIKDLVINNSTGTTMGGTINLTGILKVTSGNFNSNGFLTLVSNSTQSAVIDGSGAGQILGNVTIQGYLTSGFGYKYLSSPFQGATVNELADDLNLAATFPSVYANNENMLTAGWINYTNPAGILNPMQGYAFNFGTSATPKTFSISGVVNNATVSRTLFNHDHTFTQGFNLVGNPYPSPVNWNNASGWIKTNIDNALYFFKAGSTDQYDGLYSSYVNGVSSDGGISSNIIPAMQGFFVHVSNGVFPVSGSLTINNSARITSNASAKILKGKGEILSSLAENFNQSDLTESKIMLRLQAAYSNNDFISDPTVIYFEDESSSKFDRQTDALKLMNTDRKVPNLYSISSDEFNLSINALPRTYDSLITVPLGLKTEESGQVDFVASNLSSIPAGWNIYLRDAQNNKLHNLRRDQKYSLQLNAGKFENRFSVLFSLKDLSLQSHSLNSLNAYYSNGKLIYQLSGIAESTKGQIMISNMKGQVLNRQDFMGFANHELKIELGPGIYIVNSYTEKGMFYKKIVVN